MTLWDKLAPFGTTYTEALLLISPFFHAVHPYIPLCAGG